MDLTYASEEEPKAHGVAVAAGRQHRMEPQILFSHVLAELINVTLDR
jgi:hypothetical protein